MAKVPNTNYGDASQIRFAPLGHIYVAKAEDTKGDLPEDATSDLLATGKYSDLGYADQSGVTITPALEVEPINVWQSAVPVLQHVKGASFKLKAVMMETSKSTTELFFGAEWKQATKADGTPIAGMYRMDLKSSPTLREFTAVVDWAQTVEGVDINYRCVIPRSMLSERGSIMLQRTENSKFEMTWDALDLSGMLGFVLTDDAKMNPDAAKKAVPGGAGQPQAGGEQNEGQPQAS